jgi:ADP-heptose:LPS heptosyltransferase
MFACVDRVITVPAPWFQRPQRVAWPWMSILGLGARLREGRYDLGLEMRGELRHHLALWLSGIPLRAGQAVTAGRFLLTHPVLYHPLMHEAEQNLSLLRQLKLPQARKARAAGLRVSPASSKEAANVMKELRLTRGFVALQAACGTPAKRWQPERWAETIKGLKGQRAMVLLGSAEERPEMLRLAAMLPPARRPKVAAGMLGLGGLAALFKEASLLISVDSGPGHLAAALGTPVLGLYSGTNRASQWGLRGKATHMIQAKTPCSPCELSLCPYDNECMRRIEAKEVIRLAGTLS